MRDVSIVLARGGKFFRYTFYMKRIFLVLLLVLLSIPGASAVTFQAAENLTLHENILDDSYVVTGNANIEGDTFGDLYIAGGSVVISGAVHEDLVVAGGRVTVLGDVFGDIRVVGGQVAIYGKVGDDVVAAGGQVDIGKSSIVDGSVAVGAGILTVDGEIMEDIRGGMGMLILNGKVNRDVIITVEDNLQIDEKAKIVGDLKYSGLIETDLPKGVVGGKVQFNKFERESLLEHLTYIFFVHKILSYFSALLIALLCVLFIPNMLMKSAMVRSNFPKAFGIGLLSLIGIFIGSIILMVTVVGAPLALILLSFFVILLFTVKVFVAATCASYFLDFKKKVSKAKLFGVIALFLLGYYIIGIIPFVGWLINMVLFMIGVGIVVEIKMEQVKALKAKKLL